MGPSIVYSGKYLKSDIHVRSLRDLQFCVVRERPGRLYQLLKCPVSAEKPPGFRRAPVRIKEPGQVDLAPLRSAAAGPSDGPSSPDFRGSFQAPYRIRPEINVTPMHMLVCGTTTSGSIPQNVGATPRWICVVRPLGPLGCEGAQHRQALRPSRRRDPQQSPAS